MNEPRLVLRGCDFSKADLEGDLQNIDFSMTNFEGANIYDCNLSGCNFQGANFKNASFRNVNLQGVNLRGAKLDGVHFYNVMGALQFSIYGGNVWIAVDWGEKIMFHSKGFWGTEEEAISIIRKKYWDSSLYEQQVRLAARILENERKYY